MFYEMKGRARQAGLVALFFGLMLATGLAGCDGGGATDTTVSQPASTEPAATPRQQDAGASTDSGTAGETETSAVADTGAPSESATSSAASAVTASEDLPEYEPVSGISGTIKSVGSDTMNNLMTLWLEDFTKFYPNVKPSIEGKGSSTAPPALIEGSANFGPMSREMKSSEQDEFVREFGYQATQLPVGIDMLAVYVHKSNPIALSGLTMQQVDAIFSKTRNLGHPSNIRTWGDLGLTGEWENQPISLYGRNSASGTYGFFKEVAMGSGDFKDTVKEQPGSSSVVQGVATDRYGIGYSGYGYRTADVALVPLAPASGGDYVDPEPANAYSQEYPLWRFLYVYINHKPNTKLDPLRAEFIKYIFSRQGQQDVAKDGYLPISARLALHQLKQVNILPEDAETFAPAYKTAKSSEAGR